MREQVAAVAAAQVVGPRVLLGQPNGDGRVDEPELRWRAARDRIRADGNQLLGAIADGEEGTDPDPDARDQPPLAVQPEERPIARADQPVAVNNVEEGDGRGRRDEKADHARVGAVADERALAAEQLVRLLDATEARGRGRVLGVQVGVRLLDPLAGRRA